MKKKIVMLTMEAGPENIFRPGDERMVEEELADYMVEKRYADYVTEAAIEHKAEKREKAEAKPAIEISKGKQKVRK